MYPSCSPPHAPGSTRPSLDRAGLGRNARRTARLALLLVLGVLGALGVPAAAFATAPSITSVTFTNTKNVAQGSPGGADLVWAGPVGSTQSGDTLTVTITVQGYDALASGNNVQWFTCPTEATAIVADVNGGAQPCASPTRSVHYSLSDTDGNPSNGSVTVTTTHIVTRADQGGVLVPVLIFPDTLTPTPNQDNAWPGQIPVASTQTPPASASLPTTVPGTVGQTATISSTSVPISWPGVVDGYSYVWESSTDGGGSWTTIGSATSASYTTPTITSADDGTRFRTTATNRPTAPGLGGTAASRQFRASTTEASETSNVAVLAMTPDQPGQPTAVAGAGRARVTVTPAAAGVVPASYTVTASPGGATCPVSGASGSCTITGLTNGTAYTFTATARGASGATSSPSVASASITPQALGAPLKPTAVAGDGEATVTVAAGSGLVPSSYVVTAIPDFRTCTVTGASGSCTVTGLTNGTAYNFAAQARDFAGTGAGPPSPYSDPVTPASGPPAAPGAPLQPTVVAGDGQATVTVARGTGGLPASYTVTASPGGATCPVSGASGSCTITGLTNGTAYTFTATATNASGTSAASVASSPATPQVPAPGIPGTPTAVAGDGEATVTVSAGSGGTPTSYLVTASPGGATCPVSGASGSCTITGLTNGTAYTFTATATNAGGTSSASSPSSAVTPTLSTPGAPLQPTVVPGNAQATVTVARGTGGLPASYTVTASPGGATCVVTGASGSCTITGLTNGTAYTFTATATNAAGTSSASPASSAVTPVGPPGTPPSPTAVAGDGEATVAVVAGSGDAPTSFLVEVVGDPSLNCTVTGASGSCTITGLTNGTAYTFTATATNAGGTSPASTASSAVTPTLSAPGAPLQPTVVAGDGQATVTVARGTGGLPASYTVTASPGGATCVVTGASGSCTITGLTNGTAYTFTATATNAAGTSSASPASAAATPMAPAMPPTSPPSSGVGAQNPPAQPSAAPTGTPSPTGTVNTTPVPLALPERVATRPGARVTIDPFLNDAPSAGAEVDRTSVQLLDPRTGTWSRSVTVPGEGTWSVNPTTGRVTFTPVADFVGSATPLSYRYADSTGKRVTSSIDVTVQPGSGPLASQQVVGGMAGSPLTIQPLAGLPGGTGTWNPASVRLRQPRTGNWVTTVTIRGEGTYTVDPDTGGVTFTPLPTFVGEATPLAYRVTSRTGKRVKSRIQPVLRSAEAVLVTTTEMPARIVRVGDVIRVRVTHRNIGGAASVATTGSVTLPAGLVSVGETIARSAVGPKLTWRIPVLQPNASQSRTLLLRITDDGPMRIAVVLPGSTARSANATVTTRVLPRLPGGAESVTG